MSRHDQLSVLITTLREAEAQSIIAALATRGIEARMVGDLLTDFRVGVPGRVEVYVLSDDLARAQTALEEIRRESADLDWSQVDVGQPE
jgi:type III secretory pathway lipoprotein EscJ